MKKDRKYHFSMPMSVRDYEVDAQGIVNNAEYLHYMEHTRHEFCRAAGLSFRDMHLQGLDPVVTRVEIDYRSSLVLSEEMLSCLSIERKGPLFIFYQDIYKSDGRLAASGQVQIACLENGKLSRGERLAEAFEKYL